MLSVSPHIVGVEAVSNEIGSIVNAFKDARNISMQCLKLLFDKQSHKGCKK